MTKVVKEVREVRGQGTLGKHLVAHSQKKFIQSHCSKCGTRITVCRDNTLITRAWRTWATGAVDPDDIQQMLDFIDQ